MWWGLPKLPVTEEERQWLENSLRYLTSRYGVDRLRNANVILPDPKFFPDKYTGSTECVRPLLERVCGYMGADACRIDLAVTVEGADEFGDYLRKRVPNWEFESKGAAGQYYSPDAVSGKHLITIDSKQLNEPISLIATLAHEVAHAILLDANLAQAAEEDHEPLTDVFTVFSGMGIFNANAAFMFSQFQDSQSHGWSSRRQGYLSQEAFGYALACWAYLRGDQDLGWSQYLGTNVRSYLKSSTKYLKKGGSTSLVPMT